MKLRKKPGAYRQDIKGHFPQPVIPDERLEVRGGRPDMAGYFGYMTQEQVYGADALAGDEAVALSISQLIHFVTTQVNPA